MEVLVVDRRFIALDGEEKRWLVDGMVLGTQTSTWGRSPCQ